MPSIQHVFLVFATATSTWAELPPTPPAKIVSVIATGVSLSVEVVTDPALDPTAPFELRYVALDGTEVDAVGFQPTDSTVQTLTLDGDFPAIATRGWQHQLEIVEPGGALIDRLDLRLGLECPDAASTCEVVARPGLRIDQAIAVSPALAPYLAADEPIDLSHLAQTEPTLRAAIFEAAIDLTMVNSEFFGCHCFYSVDAPNAGGKAIAAAHAELDSDGVRPYGFGRLLFSGKHRHERERTTGRRVQLDFFCLETTGVVAQQMVTLGGVLDTNLQNLMRCPRICDSPVEWKLPYVRWAGALHPAGFWNTDFSSASAGYVLSWTIDSAQVFMQSDTWSSSPTSPLAYRHGLTLSAAGPIVAQTPTSSFLYGVASAEIRDWSESDLPLAGVMAEAAIEARGLASCAPEATVHAWPRLYGEGLTPAEITIVLGPGNSF